MAHLGGTGRHLAPPPEVEHQPERDLREEGVERTGALEAEPRQRAFLDQLHPELLPEIGRIESGKSLDLARKNAEQTAVVPANELRPRPPLAARASLDELAVAHRCIPCLHPLCAASAR